MRGLGGCTRTWALEAVGWLGCAGKESLGVPQDPLILRHDRRPNCIPCPSVLELSRMMITILDCC